MQPTNQPTNQPTKDNSRKVIALLALCLPMLISGCLMPNVQNMQGIRETGTPINTSNVHKLQKGKSTKIDVIELFGMPSAGSTAPQYPGGMPGAQQAGVLSTGSGEIYVYRHCVSGKSGSMLKIATPLDAFGKQNVTVEETCEQLSVLLGGNEVVRSFGYFSSDPVGQESVSRIIKGKSKKPDLIELVGAPQGISVSGGDEVYSYKSCISSSSAGAFSGAKFSSNCKQLTVMLDKASETVKAISFQPYQ